MELPCKVKDSNEEYHSSGFVSKSKLAWIGKSPMHFKYYMEYKQPSTPSLEFGAAFHCFVLEPDLFAEEYFILPEDFNLRTKDNKAMYQAIKDRGQKPIAYADYLTIVEMNKAINTNKYVAQLLKGEHETSYYWQDETTGINISCRPDSRRLLKGGDEGIIVDLKTCENAETEAFMKDAIKFNYDLQSYMYKEGVEKIEKVPHRFIFIAVEKKPPFAFNILEADDLFVQHGRDKFREYLGILKECQDTNNFYAYNGADQEITQLGLPAYILKDYE